MGQALSLGMQFFCLLPYFSYCARSFGSHLEGSSECTFFKCASVLYGVSRKMTFFYCVSGV